MEEKKDDLNNINPENLDVLQDEASNYNTDSDIDDPKYTPTYSSLNKDKSKKQINPEVISKTLEDKIKCIRNDNDFKAKTINEYENRINQLEAELMRVKEKLNAKEAILSEFQTVTAKSAEKFKQIEEANENLKKTNNSLVSQLAEYENQIKILKIKNEENEANAKNLTMYQEHITEMQNEFTQKEIKLNRKYQDKENSIKNEFLNEISKLTKELEELRVQNEKLKFDISSLNLNIESLKSKSEDKEYESTATINKKEKEINKLKSQIEDYQKKLNEIEGTNKEKEMTFISDFTKLKQDNESLLTTLNQKNENVYDLEAKIETLNKNIDTLVNEAKENQLSLDNKNTIIEQLKNQNEELQKEIADRDNELEILEQTRQNDANTYNAKIEQVLKEKNDLENIKAELTDNLSQANQKIKQMNAFMTDKFNSLMQSLQSEAAKNENLEKKYKSLIKSLKVKHKSLNEENKQLKEVINQKDIEKEHMEYQYQNEIKNMSLYNTINNNSVMIPNNNVVNNSMAVGYNGNNYGIGNANSSYYGVGNLSYRGEDHDEEGQKKTLEEFKRLLNTIDEKLDLPVKQN